MLSNPFATAFSGPGASFGNAVSLGQSAGFGNSSSGGGGFGMEPSTLGLGIAGIGASIFGGARAADAQADAAKQQAAAAQYAADSSAAAGSNIAKGNMFQTMFGANFGSREKDLDIGRQYRAAMLQAGPLSDAFRESKRRDALADFGFKTRGDVKAARQQANRDELKKSIAERQSQLAGMYGRIAPFNVDTFAV